MRDLLLCLLCLSFLSPACGTSPEDGEEARESRQPAAREIANIIVEPETLELSLHDTANVRAHAVDADGKRISGVSVTWSSTAQSVATVTPQGVVIAVGAGSTQLEASAGGVTGSIAVDVRGEPVASIEVAPQMPEPIAVGAVVRIAVSMFDRLHAPISDSREIHYTSSDEAVLTVSDDGVARAVAEGEATVEVEVEGVSDSITFTVVPPQIRFVELAVDPLVMVPGDVATLEAVVHWSDDVRPDFVPTIQWSIANAQVATVDEASGEVRALKEGRTSVTAVVEGMTFEFPNALDVVFDFGLVSAGGSHACGLVLDVAYCWGNNDAGQLGRADGTGPGRVDSDLRFFKLAAGGSHTCGLTHAGEVYCWGDGSVGQVGGGGTDGGPTPQLVNDEHEFKAIVAGDRHNCALTVNDELYCWGDGDQGRLGTGEMTMTPTAKLVGEFVTVSAGFSHSCAVTADNVAHCWGANQRGQLGLLNTNGPLSTPQPVQTATDLTTVVTGSHHTCGITIGGETLCWGGNGSGQVGDGTTDDRPQAALVSPNILDRRLTSGPLHTCGLTRIGEVQCWGEGDDGRLGTGSTDDALTPTVIAGSRTYFAVDAGDAFSCAIATNADVYCWGSGSDGQLGAGSSGSLAPVLVTGF